MKINTALFSAALLALGTISQLGKQYWLAETFLPSEFALIGLAMLGSQLFWSFGGGGFQNYSARQSSLIESRRKTLMMRDLVQRQLSIYALFTPVTLLIIYNALAKPTLESFGVIGLYATSHAYLNTATVPIYVRSHLNFAFIHAARGIASFVTVAVASLYASVEATLVAESLLLVAIGSYLYRAQGIPVVIFKKKFRGSMILKARSLAPFFLPIVLASISVAYNRMLANEMLSESDLGIYYFMFIIVSMGTFIQYGMSVLLGPMITTALRENAKHTVVNIVIKFWAVSLITSILVGIFLRYLYLKFLGDFYPEYQAGLVLLSALVILFAAKASDVWSVYFLLCGYQKYISITHAGVIISLLLSSYLIFESEVAGLPAMTVLIYSEAALLALLPPAIFYWLIRARVG